VWDICLKKEIKMTELIEYYKKNVCPFCNNYNTKNCTEEILENYSDDSKKVSCKNYNANIEKNEEKKIRHLYTLPPKYFSRNMREV